MALDFSLDQLQVIPEKLGRLPRPYRVAMIPLAAALVIAGYVYFFYSPAQKERRVLIAEESTLQQQVSEVQAIVSNLPAFEEKLKQMEIQLYEALRQLPDSKELPVLLTDISTIGKDSGLEISAFRPKDENVQEFYAEVPIDIEFSGSFHDIASFFDRIARLPRIVNIGQLEMTIFSQGENDTMLRVQGEARTFRFLEGAIEKPKGAAGERT